MPSPDQVSNYMEIRCNQSWAQETSWYTEACQFTPRGPFLTNCGTQVKTRQMKTQPSIIKELSHVIAVLSLGNSQMQHHRPLS